MPEATPKKTAQADVAAHHNAALFYHPEGFDTSVEKLMGRHAAGEGFLRGFARYAEVDALHCYTGTQKHFDDFKTRIAGYTNRDRPLRWRSFGDDAALRDPGCLFYPSPNMSDLAWNRRHTGKAEYSLCGVTHTTASGGVMDAMGEYLVAPYRTWDAVVCTSNAVHAMVRRLLDDHGEYLASHLGLKQRVVSPVQLPVIPLGVEMAEFPARSERQAERAALRTRLGIADNDLAVLFMGRLSWHAKAHPFPIAAGLQAATTRTGRKAHLLLAGWFPNESIEKSFHAMFAVACPDVQVHVLDGRTSEIRRHVWYAADIFASMSENIQETFGLTPIEAMAAGLPCVVTDWNGYQDTVRDGVDGLRIKTVMPPPGAGRLLAQRYARKWDIYDRYVGYAAQSTAVDIDDAALAFETLFGNDDLRQQMGDAGRARATETYDWRHIVRHYQALWGELAQRRNAATADTARIEAGPRHPLRDDPFRLFQHYATAQFSQGSVVAANDRTRHAYFSQVSSLAMHRLAKDHLLSPAATVRMLDIIIEMQRVTVHSLSGLDLGPEGAVYRTVGWLYKIGAVTIEP